MARVSDPRETHIVPHEGSLIFSTESDPPTTIFAALVLAAVTDDVPGEATLRWRVHGSPINMVPVLARFLHLNPAFARAVEGVLAMLVTGQMSGGEGPGAGCPVHGGPAPDDAPSPAHEGE
jgi:hypothetical protein